MTNTFDWSSMIEELILGGMSEDAIGRAMQSVLTPRMVAAYRKGAQPLFWRGEMLIELWCCTTGKDRGKAPVSPVIRGHRVDRRLILGPRMQTLPNWPPCPPAAVAPRIKRKYQRKVAEAA